LAEQRRLLLATARRSEDRMIRCTTERRRLLLATAVHLGSSGRSDQASAKSTATGA
jgi:hypothetical protein